MDPLSRAKRDAVTRLCQAQAAGLLSVEAFERRYDLIREAGTASMVEAIVADLAEAGSEPWLGAVPPSPDPISRDPALLPAEKIESVRIPSVLGSTHRAGDWTVPEMLELLVVLGEVTLDFRDAVFTTDTVVIDASVYAGSLKLIVPPGTQVETECREILASSTKRHRRRRPAESNGLLLTVRGTLMVAELVIKERAPDGQGPVLLGEPPG